MKAELFEPETEENQYDLLSLCQRQNNNFVIFLKV